MIDRLKTLALIVLIIGSLFQTYLLIYSTPKYDPIVLTGDYVQLEPRGEQKLIEDLIFPDYMLFHTGEGKHTMLYPKMGHFYPILESIKQRSFEGFRKINPLLLDLNLEDIRNKRKGIELHFREGVPLQILQKLFQIKDTFGVDNDTITNIWIFTSEFGDEVRAYFFTSTRSEAYELIRTDITVKDMDKLVGWGEKADEYYTKNGDYYLPVKPVKIPSYQFGYTQMNDDQLKRTLFVDPGIVRSLKERDGSQIYTDGKKGLQLNQRTRWMKYTDPIVPAGQADHVLENMNVAVQFINQHGGWNGTYGLSRLPDRQTDAADRVPEFEFRNYYGSYPIIQPNHEGFGLMVLQTQKGIVTSYERSIVIPDTNNVIQNDAALPGGEELEEILNELPNRYSIVSIFPGYRAVESDQRIDLKPAWVIKYRSGNYEFLVKKS